MVPVESMLSTSFWAVPAFMRVEPVMTSGPVTGVDSQLLRFAVKVYLPYIIIMGCIVFFGQGFVG